MGTCDTKSRWASTVSFITAPSTLAGGLGLVELKDMTKCVGKQKKGMVKKGMQN
jgi:hypothetical protein